MSSLIWITARGELRQEIDDEVVTASRSERFDRARTVSTGVMNQSASDYLTASGVLIERLWAIYYPAMAVERVPFIVPHTDGEIMMTALTHLVTPRFLYPDKADLESDSEMVRRYSGAQVAGTDEGTSIAFGYAAESYVDFGLPYMFIPVLIFGFFMGLAFQTFFSVIKHRELAISLVTVIFWIALYLFERSWVKTLGTTITMMVCTGRPDVPRRPVAPDATQSAAGHWRRRSLVARCGVILRVVHVCAYFAPAFVYGGPPRSILGLCRAQRDAGVDVEVVTTTANGDSELAESVVASGEYDGIPVRYCERAWPRSVFRAPMLRDTVAEALRSADVLHIHGLWNATVWSAAAAARQERRPYVVSPRGMLAPAALAHDAWRKRLVFPVADRRVIRAAARLHATSRPEFDEPGRGVGTGPHHLCSERRRAPDEGQRRRRRCGARARAIQPSGDRAACPVSRAHPSHQASRSARCGVRARARGSFRRAPRDRRAR